MVGIQPSRVNMRIASVRRCEELVESGEFMNFSDVVNFAIRVFYDDLRSGEPPDLRHITRNRNCVAKSVRLEPIVFAIAKIAELEKADVPDYALDYYLNTYRSRRNLP